MTMIKRFSLLHRLGSSKRKNSSSSTMSARPSKRNCCVFETTKTWTVKLDGDYHRVTARWEGILKGRLVVIVDGQLHGIFECEHDDRALDPYGNWMMDGHELEVFPHRDTWRCHEQSMVLKVDGNSATLGDLPNEDDRKKARVAAEKIPFSAFGDLSDEDIPF